MTAEILQMKLSKEAQAHSALLAGTSFEWLALLSNGWHFFSIRN